MFNKADVQKRGYISKKQLLESIQDDIVNGHEDVLLEQNRESIRQSLMNAEPKEEIYGETNQNNDIIETGKQINDPKEDPVLQMLQNQNRASSETDGSDSFQNLVQALEYIKMYKISQYCQSEDSL